jgi:hypothetical protein
MFARTLRALTCAALLNLSMGVSPPLFAQDPQTTPPVGAMSPIPQTAEGQLDEVSDSRGDRKATAAPEPAVSEIVAVKWSSTRSNAMAALKGDGAVLPFDAAATPVTDWGSSSEFPLASRQPTAAAETKPADSAPELQQFPAPVINELQSLIPPAPKQQVPTHDSYVAELMSLLPEQSAWVSMSGDVLDLAPGEPHPSYMAELETLTRSATNTYRAASMRRRLDEQPPEGQPGGNYRIPPAVACDTIGGSPITGLFEPLDRIDVNSASTAPPRIPKKTQEALVLTLPKDKSCGYLTTEAPGYYFTAPKFGGRRPNRNTFAFCNGPLYFEDPNLERCGRSYGCLTTLHSTARFYSRIAILPYLATAEPPQCKVRALPDCPTCHEFGHDAEYPDWSWQGAAVQAAVVTGLVFLIP